MLSDLDIALLLQSQYDGVQGVFDFMFHTSGVDYAIKSYPDCTAIIFEGSHDLPDWISNFKADMVHIPDFAGVERGFNDGLPDVMVQVIPLLNKLKPVYVAGHSRGAAHAHIFAAMLIKLGYQISVVVFGSPRPGDAKLAAILAQAPNRSYRNYHDFDQQDFVCDVPSPFPFGFVHPTGHQTIDVSPLPNDPWLLLGRHHLSLYIKGLQT